MPNVSYQGIEKDRDLLNLLSIRLDKPVGVIVREAVREKHGKQMDELDRLFFASQHADTHEKRESAQKKDKQKA